MSDTDFILTPGFKQLEMLTAGLSVLPCCSPCLPWQQESTAWFFGGASNILQKEMTIELHLERFPSSECDAEFSLVWGAVQSDHQPRAVEVGSHQGQKWGDANPLLLVSVCAGDIKVQPGLAENSQTLAEIRGAALQPLQAALPPCPRLLCVTCCHSPCSALLEGWQDSLELPEWELQWLKGYSKRHHLSASWAGFGLSTSSFLCPTGKEGAASSTLAGRWL